MNELKTRTAYAIHNQPGTWLFLGYTAEATATMRKLGDDTITLDTDPAAITPATVDQLHHGLPDTATLATEAAVLFRLDPARIQRAAAIANQRGMIVLAQRDENGQTIAPSYDVIAVRSQSNPRGWYIVRKGSCTCPDAADGKICKHRIAAWMYKELAHRPGQTTRAAAANRQPQPVHAEMVKQ